MKTNERPFLVRWGIFAERFARLDDAIDRANKVIVDHEGHHAEVVTQEYRKDWHNSSTKWETTHYCVSKPIRPKPVRA